jgi:hypothetical protein
VLLAEISSSACSGMFGSMYSPLHVGPAGYASSIADLNGLLRRVERPRGEAGRCGAVTAGMMNLPVESTPGLL